MSKIIIFLTLAAALFYLSRFSRQIKLYPSASKPDSAAPSSPPAGNSENLIGINSGEFPWPAEKVALKSRLISSGLSVLSQEGSLLHTHQHLRIFVRGQAVPVPAGIGQGGDFISPLHTHDDDGIIHVESPEIRDFTLGQFFDVWGVRFNDHCLGVYCNTDDLTLRLFVNGRPIDSDFRSLKLTPHLVIVLTYGKESDQTLPVPSVFSFPPGY